MNQHPDTHNTRACGAKKSNKSYENNLMKLWKYFNLLLDINILEEVLLLFLNPILHFIVMNYSYLIQLNCTELLE